MKLLSRDQIIELHKLCIEETGGSHGFRDEGMFDSALAAPLQSFGGIDFYPTIEQKAARLGYGLIKNHSFIDGNKRIGTVAMLTLLSLNGIELDHTQEELSGIILEVAAGTREYEDLLEWVIKHET